MKKLLVATGLLLALPVSNALAQTACTATAPNFGAACVNTPTGDSSVGGGSASGTAGTVTPPEISNDPLGTQSGPSATPPRTNGMLDQGITGSIPSPPQPLGMAPLIIPNNPLGSSTGPSGNSGTTFGNPGISSP